MRSNTKQGCARTARASSRFVVCAVAKTTTECQASVSISVTLVTSHHLKNIPWEWFMKQDWKSAESLQRFLFYFIALQSALPSLAFDLYLSPWWPLTSWKLLENCPYLVHQTRWGWGDGEVKRALTAGSAVFKMQYSLNETAYCSCLHPKTGTDLQVSINMKLLNPCGK